MRSSRAFSSRHLFPGIPAFPLLTPVIDILNHSTRSGVEWGFTQTPPKTFSVKINHPISTGSEVLNNYGPKQNAEFMLEYGFSIAQNTSEQVLMEGSIKSEVLKSTKDEQIPFGMDPAFVTRPQTHPFQYARTRGHVFGRYANDVPNLQGFPPYHVFAYYLNVMADRGMPWPKTPSGPPTGRVTLATILKLYRVMQVKCVELSIEGLPSPSNIKQTHALNYRLGQAELCEKLRRELKAVLDALRYGKKASTEQEASIWTVTDAMDKLSEELPELHEEVGRFLLLDYTWKLIGEDFIWMLLLVILAARYP